MADIEIIKGGMAFQLKDGAVLWISKEDCNELKNKILLDGVVGKDIKAVFLTDGNMTKAKDLHSILTTEKGMPPELRVQYYEEILRLYKTEGEKNEKPFFDEVKDKTKP